MVNAFKRFGHKIVRKWRENLQLSSKITVIVALLEVLSLWFIAIFSVATPQKGACVNDTGIAVDCSSAYLVNQSVMMFTFSGFFFFSIFQGIFHDNLYDLYAAMFQACFITAWAVFRFLQDYTNKVVDYVFLIVTCVCQLFYFVVAFSLRTEYVWRLYRKAGADKKFRDMYKTYLKWLTFFKLDAAFSIPNVLLAARGVLSFSWRAGVNWTMFVIIVVFLVVGLFGVKREITRLTVAWFFMFPLNLFYIIGMMYYVKEFNQSPEADYTTRTLALMFYITGSVTLVNRVILAVYSYLVFKNFKQGLRKLEYLRGEEPEEEGQQQDGKEAATGTTVGIAGSTGGDYGYVAYGDSEDDEDLSVTEVIKATYASFEKGSK